MKTENPQVLSSQNKQLLGKTQFGERYKVREGGRSLQCRVERAANEEAQAELERRIAVLRKLPKHPNIIKIHRIQAKKEFVVLEEYCEQGTLEDLVAGRPFRGQAEVLAFVFQVSEGLRALWSSGLLHCDLSPRAIGLSNSVFKLCDFSECKQINGKTVQRGRTNYSAPERLTRRLHESSDVFSLALVVYFAVYGKHMFEDQLEQPQKELPTAAQKSWPESPLLQSRFNSTLRKMLEVDPAKRLSWEEYYLSELYLTAKAVKRQDDILLRAVSLRDKLQSQEVECIALALLMVQEVAAHKMNMKKLTEMMLRMLQRLAKEEGIDLSFQLPAEEQEELAEQDFLFDQLTDIEGFDCRNKGVRRLFILLGELYLRRVKKEKLVDSGKEFEGQYLNDLLAKIGISFLSVG